MAGQVETKEASEEAMQKEPPTMEASDKRKLDDVILAALAQKAKHDEGMFRE